MMCQCHVFPQRKTKKQTLRSPKGKKVDFEGKVDVKAVKMT